MGEYNEKSIQVLEGLEPEEWRDIPGTSRYQVSNRGRVKRLSHDAVWFNSRGTKISRHYPESILVPNTSTDYLSVTIYGDDNSRNDWLIHRLVAMVFLPSWNSNLQVNHIDGNKHNNHIENLEMVTCKENVEHFRTHPLMEEARINQRDAQSRSQKIAHNRPNVKSAFTKVSKAYNSQLVIRNWRSENLGTHVICIEDNLVFPSRQICAHYYHVDYAVIKSRCELDVKQPRVLQGKTFRYMPEDEYQLFKKENPERVIMYV